VGKLVVSAPGMANREIPLVAETDIEKLGLVAKMGATLTYMVLGAPK
jgi:hypothetical protein